MTAISTSNGVVRHYIRKEKESSQKNGTKRSAIATTIWLFVLKKALKALEKENVHTVPFSDDVVLMPSGKLLDW